MNNLYIGTKKWPGKCLPLIACLIFTLSPCTSFHASAQNTGNVPDRMPADLETDFALSSLPAHLRSGATVYLFDPAKGYYVSRQGSNGFTCFVSRMEWEWAEYRNDLGAAMGFDAEGSQTIFRAYLDAAAMWASGKFTALQVRDTIVSGIKKGLYKAPSKTGICYMLAPVMRAYANNPGDGTVMTMSGPHYMFYAPYQVNSAIGGNQFPEPVVGNPGDTVLGDGKGPFGYVIVLMGEMEKRKIVEDSADLLKRLGDYKAFYKIAPGMGHHH